MVDTHTVMNFNLLVITVISWHTNTLPHWRFCVSQSATPTSTLSDQILPTDSSSAGSLTLSNFEQNAKKC